MSQGLFQQHGAALPKPPKLSPINIDRWFQGYYTNKYVFRDPSDLGTLRFYGGAPDTITDGLNVELNDKLYIQRRPGLVPFSGATYPTPPLTAFSFELLDGTIQVIVDTGSTPSFALSGISVISKVVYATFATTQPTAAANSFAGLIFNLTGFDEGQNNGAWQCISSTDSYLILNAPSAVTDSSSGAAISAGAVFYDDQIGDRIFLFAKQPGAGQTHFVASGGILYFSDGTSGPMKYTPGNPNLSPPVWNWGTPPPSVGPSVTLTPSGSAASAWSANTVFSTMGIIIDPNGNAQELISVNSNGTNPSPATLGTSGNGAPDFNTAVNGTTSDGSVTWTCQSAITLWTPNTNYIPNQVIYDPATNSLQVFTHNFDIKSGSIYPNFSTALVITGARVTESTGARWGCLGVVGGTPSCVSTWQKDTAYNRYLEPSGGSDPNALNCAVVYPIIPTETSVTAAVAGTGPEIFLLGATTAGTSHNGAYSPWTGIASQTPGITTLDAVPGATTGLTWLCLGSATWAANTEYSAWSAQGSVFSCIEDSNSNLQVCIVGGTSYSGAPTWNTGYGSITTEASGVQWSCVGPAGPAWAASTQWSLPLTGFQPPSAALSFGSSEVIGSNFVQNVVVSGKSSGSPPSWPIIIGNQVTDGGITWQTTGAYSQNSLSWTAGYCYAYSLGSRLTSDFYNTAPPPGLESIYPNGLGTPTGSQTGLISTASPAFQITGSNSGSVNTISGLGSTDPQIDTVYIWRSPDQTSGSASMLFLTELPAPLPKQGVAQPWSFNDYLPDLPSTINGVTYPGLNTLEQAPIDEVNNPPLTTFLPQIVSFERIWCANGQSVNFSGGPDVLVGNSFECFNPADVFFYLAEVTRLVQTSQGTLVFLPNSIQAIVGGPSTASFYQTIFSANGPGLSSWNALDVFAGELVYFASNNQATLISPSLNISNAGFAIQDQFLEFNPSTVYVAYQQVANDTAVFWGNGSTGWYRENLYTTPGNASGAIPTFSPFAEITGGCGMLLAIETSPGKRQLLVGSTEPNQPILVRDLNVFQDNGVSYGANFTISLCLAEPGRLGILKFLEGDFSYGCNPKFGGALQTSFLLDEIAAVNGAVFQNFALDPSVQDPPSRYGPFNGGGSGGANGASGPLSFYAPRWYFNSINSYARARNISVNVNFGDTSSSADSCFALTLFGGIFQEG